MSNETHMLDRLIEMVRENERLQIELNDIVPKLEKANDRIVLLESAELLAELKTIEGSNE